MLSLNVLIVIGGKYRGNYLNSILSSKFLNKLYVVSDDEITGAITINFNTFQELANKCKALRIDMVIVDEERWVMEGIGNVMRLNKINCFAVTSDWTDLKLSYNYSRNILEKYKINVPPIINFPTEFPVILKGDGILEVASSLQDIIKIREKVSSCYPELSKTVVTEKFLRGEKVNVISLFDGKNLLTFPNEKINKELLCEYSNHLKSMLLSEGSSFIGFINSYLIEEDGILYNTGFNFGFVMPDLSGAKNELEKDILYICNAALYQKLNEIEI